MKLISFFLAATLTPSAIAATLKPDAKVQLDGKAAKFDFMASDFANHRVLAAHKGAGTLEIVDTKSGKPLKAVRVGEAQGVAVDNAGNRYFVGNDGDQSVVVLDAKSFAKLAEIKVDAPVDAITFDTKSGNVYAAADNGDHLWVVNPTTKKVVGKVKIPGVPEGLEYSPTDDRIYLSIKDKNQVVKINPGTNEVEKTVSTLPVTSPHGLAVDAKRGIVFVAGKNGKIVSVDFKTGRVVSQADIAENNDQLVFDPEKDLIFSACKGEISVTQVTDSGLKALGQVISPKGAHTIALDRDANGVWVVFADEQHSYFQKFLAR